MAEGESAIVIDESEIGESKPQDAQVDVDDDESHDVMTLEQAELEWNQLTVEELKEELVDRGLGTNGKKSDLVARLLANEFGDFFNLHMNFFLYVGWCYILKAVSNILMW